MGGIKWRYVVIPVLILPAMVASVFVINRLCGRIDSDPVAYRYMETRAMVNLCHGAVVFWSAENQRAPSTAEGWAVLGMKRAVPRDGYGRPLVYRHDDAGPPLQFALYSLGVNGVDEQGGGDDVSYQP